MANEKSKDKTDEVAAIKFTKQQLLNSKKYINRQDALNALLKDDKHYSFDEVDKVLNKFYKGGNK